MNKTVVLLLGVVTILLFQNCGRMVSSTDAPVGKESVPQTTEVKLVSVRPVTSSDPNQPTEVILDGYFADGCPATLNTDVETNGTNHRVRATITKTVSPGQACTMVLRVFEEKVSLGDLAPGTHTIEYETYEGPKTLTITIN